MNFNHKTIFVFSDPAGGNSISSLIDNLLNIGKTPNINFKVYTDFEGIIHSSYEKLINRIENNPTNILEEILYFKPKLIFTTTSNNNFEHNWRIQAKLLNIKVVSFVDHWTGIRNRFNFNGEEIFPDIIYVIDKKASEIAINEGIPSDLIKKLVNPYYKKVKNFKPSCSKSEFYSLLNLNSTKKLILFISDDIKKSETLKNIGFDEFTIIQKVLESFYNLKKLKKIDFERFTFIIKIHPRASKNKFIKYYYFFEDLNLEYKIIKDFDSLTLNYYSDYILGMFSNMVIESFLMKKKLIRVQIGIKCDDPIGFEPLYNKFINDEKELETSFSKILS